jgi:Tfp pilus assembly protein PilF
LQNPPNQKIAFKRRSFLILLTLLIGLAYSNALQVPWHLDDFTNIVDNSNVHVTTLSPDDWIKSVRPPFSDPDNPGAGLSGFYRPVAMLTFGFNWFVGQSHVFGYHLVNIGLHVVTGMLLFLTILNLLRTPNIGKRYKGSHGIIAMVSTGLWALHPIHTQAVNYIVQRMAILAALFYLLGLLLYLKARFAQTPFRCGLLFSLCGCSFILAVGSKQNAATLPLALLLIEAIFFVPRDFWKKARALWIGMGFIFGGLVLLGLVFMIWQKNPVSLISDGYQMRPFSMAERLMTEFRIVVFYLGQLIYPVPQQFSILHDVQISKSLLNPWTTLAALTLIVALVLTALYGVHRYPMLSFGLLFFFLTHSIESTILPLELIFEHRNYLPSLFLFLPLASAVMFLMNRYGRNSRLVYISIGICVGLLLMGLGLGTYTRNFTWADEKALWQDALQKAPNLARPYQNLAKQYEKENRLDTALKLYQEALSRKDSDPKLSRFISLANMGNIYKKANHYDKAVHYLRDALQTGTGPYTQIARYNLVLCLLNSNQETQALQALEPLLQKQADNAHYLSTQSFLLLRQANLDAALSAARQALSQKPRDLNSLLLVGMTLSAKGFHDRAAWFLQSARKQYPRNLIVYLGLIQNAVKQDSQHQVAAHIRQLANRFAYTDIIGYLEHRMKGYHYISGTLVPINDRIIKPHLITFINQRAEEMQRDS